MSSHLHIILTLLLVGPVDGAGCGDCWCVRNSSNGEACPYWSPHSYSSEDITTYRESTLLNPILLPCNPYIDVNCTTDPPQAFFGEETICALRYTDDCSEYGLRTFPDRGTANRAGFVFTHMGACGVCSSLQDLAAYMEHTDMYGPARTCGALALVSDTAAVASCFQNTERMSPTCAQLTAYDAVEMAEGPCREQCQDWEPYNLPPDCRLNDCMQCDTDGPGIIYKRFSGRTKQNSGILSAVQRNCSELAFVDHYACMPRTGSAFPGRWIWMYILLACLSLVAVIVIASRMLHCHYKRAEHLETSLQHVRA